MTRTIPRNDSTKQLNEIVDEIYHVKDPLNSLPRLLNLTFYLGLGQLVDLRILGVKFGHSTLTCPLVLSIQHLMDATPPDAGFTGFSSGSRNFLTLQIV